MKRGFALAAAVLSSALVVTGCARDTGTPSTGGGATAGGTQCTRNAAPAAAGAAASTAPALAQSDASGLRVGLAYDIGGRGDQSFNDAAAAGLERAIGELGLVKENTRELSAAPNESEDAAATRLRQLVADGFNPIIAVGFKYATATQTVAAESPQVNFAIVDDNTVNLPNVTAAGLRRGAGLVPRRRRRRAEDHRVQDRLRRRRGDAADPEVRGGLRGRREGRRTEHRDRQRTTSPRPATSPASTTPRRPPRSRAVSSTAART